MAKIRNIALLSNINVTSIKNKLCDSFNIYCAPGFNTWMNEILNRNSGIYTKKPTIAIFLIDGTFLAENSDNCSDIDIKYKAITDYAELNPETSVLVSNIDVLEKNIVPLNDISLAKTMEMRWNYNLQKNKKSNIYYFDLKEIVSEYGRKNLYSKKGWYLGNLRFSNEGEKILSREISKALNSFFKSRKKCLIIDLDNTIWGGIVGEDGIDGVKLNSEKTGSEFYEFQKMIKVLKNQGVLLAICSKNNFLDVKEIFHNNINMILKLEDFISMRINWKPKVENIYSIATELNIGLNSIVFIDDNPFEIESVKSEFPEIESLKIPLNTLEIPSWFTEVQKVFFEVPFITEEDENKTAMYKSQIERDNSHKGNINLEKYLISLEMKLNIRKACVGDLPRIMQLIQKTNQFNLTTKRYCRADVVNMLNEKEFEIFIGNLEDKFGGYGTIALAIVEIKDNKAIIDTFLMSCRAMGRNVEYHFIWFIENYLREKEINQIVSLFAPTKRNIPVKEFWNSLGYNIIKKDDFIEMYSLDISEEKNRIFYSELTQ